MPNWVDNRLIITADEETLSSIKAKVNWTENNNAKLAESLYPLPDALKLVSGWSDETASYWVDEHGEPQQPPSAEEIGATTLSQYSLTEEQKAELINEYGATNWYQWNILNYGSKWPDCYTEARELNDNKQIYFSFESAWAPMGTLAERISKDFKCKVVLKHYSIENMSEGTMKWDSGHQYYYLSKDVELDWREEE